MRGEYRRFATIVQNALELPPRARRIQRCVAEEHSQLGTTSACAENTICGAGVAWHLGNYLRVRGEYGTITPCAKVNTELPPRARRIRLANELDL